MNSFFCSLYTVVRPVLLFLSYSRQQRSPFATRIIAREVWTCSVLTDIDAPRGCAPIQCTTSRLVHQIRCVCASSAWLEAQQDPFLDRSCWCCVVASVARLMPGHPIGVTLKASSKDGTTPSPPHMRHNVGNRRTTWPTKRWDRLRNLKT